MFWVVRERIDNETILSRVDLAPTVVLVVCLDN